MDLRLLENWLRNVCLGFGVICWTKAITQGRIPVVPGVTMRFYGVEFLIRRSPAGALRQSKILCVGTENMLYL